jgi:hypothetical protein
VDFEEHGFEEHLPYCSAGQSSATLERRAMPVLKPRNRLVYFRISEEEFRKVSDICQSEGARSLSDLARQAMQRLISDGALTTDGLMAEKLKTIDAIIYELNQKLQQLTKLLEGHPAGGENGSAILESPLTTPKEEQPQC